MIPNMDELSIVRAMGIASALLMLEYPMTPKQDLELTHRYMQ